MPQSFITGLYLRASNMTYVYIFLYPTCLLLHFLEYSNVLGHNLQLKRAIGYYFGVREAYNVLLDLFIFHLAISAGKQVSNSSFCRVV